MSEEYVMFEDENMTAIHAGLKRKQRLDRSSGMQILQSNDILGLGRSADEVRRRKVGRTVTFVGNFHVCYTNVCKNHCRGCTFRKDSADQEAFTLDLAEIKSLARECRKSGVPEILILGGINPELKFDFFVEVLEQVRKEIPEILVLGFSPVEIDHFSKETGTSVGGILKTLKDCGLAAITGGGAEIFSPRVRKLLGCEEKISGDRWLEIMEEAHVSGIRSNASIMYGAGETMDERLDHLERIREVQDRTGGFTHILPFAYTDPSSQASTTGFDDMKMIALCRLYLDNFDHVRAYWSNLGLKGAQLALSFGADDLNGLRQKGRIIHSSGGQPPSFTTKETMISLIRDCGRIPAQRDILFNIVKTYEG